MKKKILDAVAAGQDIYMAVVYCTDGSIHLLPEPDKESAYRVLLRMRVDPKCCERIAGTTIAKRSAAGFGDGKIFGSPKSLDVMQLSEKQFENMYAKYVGDPDGDPDGSPAAAPEAPEDF